MENAGVVGALRAHGVHSQVLGMETFCEKMFSKKVAVEASVQPIASTKGATLPPVHLNLSMLDMKSAFVTCQRGDGGDEGNATIDFDEFLVCLALCGHIKYEEVEQMSLAQRVEGIVANYLGERDEQAVVTAAVAPPVERFDAKTLAVLPGQAADQHAQWQAAWSKMDLSHVFGFPLWEKEVCVLLQRSFPELSSIFTHYAKSGSAGSGSAHAAETMQQTELTNLALDCGLATEAFPMARVQGVFARADQTDDGRGGDHALELHEFLEAVVMLSFSRANPRFGEVGREHSAEVTLPQCLETLLKRNLLTKAKQDTLGKVRRMVEKEPEVQMALRPLKPRLRPPFAAACAADSTPAGTAPTMSMETFCQDLFDRKVTRDVTVRPTPAVIGASVAPVHSNLSWLDAKGAFVTCQASGESDAARQTLSFDEFVVCLALCGHIKYEEVEQMSLAQRVEGIVANYLGERDEQAVVTAAVAPPVERFDAKTLAVLPGQAADQHAQWQAAWSKMDLSHVFGFPLWEKEVCVLLQRSFPELSSIFTHYAKSGSAGSGSAHAAETMQQTELTNLALDCGLATEAFPMARVQGVFARADQTDDGRGGDHALELHEFLEAVVMLSFSRANPRFGEVGREHSAEVTLPQCLETLLAKHLLKNAKRDSLAKIKRLIEKAPEATPPTSPCRLPRVSPRKLLPVSGEGDHQGGPPSGQARL